MTAAPRTALVTGSAGFIGYHVCRRLLDEGWRVTGLDAMTDYYDVTLKRRRHAMLSQSPGFTPVEARLEEPGRLHALTGDAPEIVVHLAAQAGVRYSIDEPESYVESNLIGTFRLVEALRAHPPRHLLLASTSSVYGAETDMPYREDMAANVPMSFYAATKKATEAMAHSYAHLYDLPVTAFRFFTVYGPWGRPDMALFRFVRAILEGKPIDVYNHGEMSRDFTYVDDLVEAVRRLIDVPPAPPEARDADAAIPGDSLSPAAPFRVVNIGANAPVRLDDFIAAVEAALGRTAERRLLPRQAGDVLATWADTTLLDRLTGYRPDTPLTDGVEAFVAWYRDHYQI